MVRKLEIKKNNLMLKDSKIDGFFERVVTPFGTSAKADIPRKYLKKRVYIIVTKDSVNE
ncbi:MAG: DUF2080 family transposase-associated protein [Candidatus Aenigmatarchaeota archaeon]